MATVALAASAVIMFSMLLAAAAIPRELIRRNALASGERLMSLTESTFWDIFPGFYPSREDKYSDSILLGIAWQYDEHDVLGSVLSSRYYTNEKDITASLVSAVREDIPANMEYLRYWHGSLALVRPLLVFMPVQAIYAIDAVVMAVLSVWLAIRLAMRRAWGPLAGFLLALLSVSAWFVPLSLEYTWVFLIMLVEMHIILWKRFDDGWLPAFFAVSGAVTAFMDFLTAETITLTMPLLLVLWLRRDSVRRTDAKAVLQAIVPWLAGYAGMWALKWLLACTVCGYSFALIGERMQLRSFGMKAGGTADQVSQAFYWNISQLLPFPLGAVWSSVALCAAAACAVLVWTRRGAGADRMLIECYALVLLIPFARFAVMNNHAFIHFFFAYRALAGSVMAGVLIADETMSVKPLPSAGGGSRLGGSDGR
jgi:hypothetical protein